jgi:hypothetical protein
MYEGKIDGVTTSIDIVFSATYNPLPLPSLEYGVRAALCESVYSLVDADKQTQRGHNPSPA